MAISGKRADRVALVPTYRLPVEVWATLRRLEREIPVAGAYGAADMIDDYAYLGTPE